MYFCLLRALIVKEIGPRVIVFDVDAYVLAVLAMPHILRI